MPGKTTKKVSGTAGSPRGRKPEKTSAPSDYLIALLIDGSGIHASWKISDPLYKKILSQALLDYHGDPFLFLEVHAVDSEEDALLGEAQVYGKENRWHIFITKEMAGRRIVLRLTYQTAKARRETVLQSTEIDVPLNIEALAGILSRPMLYGERGLLLYRASGLAERNHPSSPGPSSP